MLTRRDLQVLELREVYGLTYRKIGQALGVGSERARQLYERANRRRPKALRPFVTPHAD